MKTRLPATAEQPRSTRLAPPSTHDEPSADAMSDSESADPGDGSRLNRIAERAHEIYKSRGGKHGEALDDWLQAEREINGEN